MNTQSILFEAKMLGLGITDVLGAWVSDGSIPPNDEFALILKSKPNAYELKLITKLLRKFKYRILYTQFDNQYNDFGIYITDYVSFNKYWQKIYDMPILYRGHTPEKKALAVRRNGLGMTIRFLMPIKYSFSAKHTYYWQQRLNRWASRENRLKMKIPIPTTGKLEIEYSSNHRIGRNFMLNLKAVWYPDDKTWHVKE